MHRSVPLPKTTGGAPTEYELEYNKNWVIRQEEMAKLLLTLSPVVMREQNFPNEPKSPRVKKSKQHKSAKQQAPIRRSARCQPGDGTTQFFGSIRDIEPELSSPKAPRVVQHKAGPPTPLLVEEVTDTLLENIALSSSQKIYSQNGSTCHQCRQKTLDTKTVCRSETCVGVRGQFCQQCLINHYGEHVRDALLNKDWSCPVCRDICNCSICRTRKNKIPLGIIIHLARDQGFSSVHEFIQSEEDNGVIELPVLKEEAQYTDENDTDENDNDHNSSWGGLVVDKSVYDEFERRHMMEM